MSISRIIRIMKKVTHTQYLEKFHLLFLDQLGRRIDKQLYVLKGGCNLRFFYKSIRYSQDIDLDIQTIRKETLANNVEKILSSQPFQMALKQAGIEIETVSAPKQTETTQRWKLSLNCEDSPLPIHTKIEFSRRGFDSGVIFEPVDPMIIQQYHVPPILANHYSAEAAYQQKVGALAGRRQTQARDVFDIYHLLNVGVDAKKRSQPPEICARAESAALSLTYEDFLGQVVSFLPAEYQGQYSDPQLWDSMVLSVIGAIK